MPRRRRSECINMRSARSPTRAAREGPQAQGGAGDIDERDEIHTEKRGVEYVKQDWRREAACCPNDRTHQRERVHCLRQPVRPKRSEPCACKAVQEVGIVTSVVEWVLRAGEVEECGDGGERNESQEPFVLQHAPGMIASRSGIIFQGTPNARPDRRIPLHRNSGAKSSRKGRP